MPRLLRLPRVGLLVKEYIYEQEAGLFLHCFFSEIDRKIIERSIDRSIREVGREMGDRPPLTITIMVGPPYGTCWGEGEEELFASAADEIRVKAGLPTHAEERAAREARRAALRAAIAARQRERTWYMRALRALGRCCGFAGGSNAYYDYDDYEYIYILVIEVFFFLMILVAHRFIHPLCLLIILILI